MRRFVASISAKDFDAKRGKESVKRRKASLLTESCRYHTQILSVKAYHCIVEILTTVLKIMSDISNYSFGLYKY